MSVIEMENQKIQSLIDSFDMEGYTPRAKEYKRNRRILIIEYVVSFAVVSALLLLIGSVESIADLIMR